ncbi:MULTISPECIES: hypothetical protein [unclassified Bradyrhizobium]
MANGAHGTSTGQAFRILSTGLPSRYRARPFFVLAAWILFDRQNDTELPLAIVNLFLLVAVMLPYLLWRTWRNHQRLPPSLTTNSGFRKWTNESAPGLAEPLKGSDAAIDMLLSLASVAFGLLALGIVFNLS